MAIVMEKGNVEAVYNTVKRNIVKGQIQPGEKLAPLRELSKKYNVSYLTIQRAISKLNDDGVLTSRQGIGVFVKDDVSLVASSSHNFNLIMVGYKYDMSGFPVYAKLLYGLEKEIAKSNGKLSVVRVESVEDINKKSILSDADGLFLFWDDKRAGLKERLSSRPCVWLMGESKSWGDHITYNDFNIGKVAVEYLRGKGYERVAYMGTKGNSDRKLGFKIYSQNNGMDVKWLTDDVVLWHSNSNSMFHHEIIENQIDAILSSKEKIDAVFVEMDSLAVVVYNALERRGVKVGSDIEILGCNYEESLLASLPKKPATVDIHAEKIGRIAVEQMKWRINNPNEERMVIKLEPSVKVF